MSSDPVTTGATMSRPPAPNAPPPGAAPSPAAPDLAEESVAGEEDPGAALDDGEPCENDPALRRVPDGKTAKTQ
jgi:hypothetical protein